MFQTRPSTRCAAALVVTLTLTGTIDSASAQPGPSTSARQAAGAQTMQTAPLSAQSAADTRRAFYQVLEQYPPGLGRVMRLDPTLMSNQAYLASYPAVAAFLQQNPDVPRNPGFYLERYDPNYSIPYPPDPRREALAMWRNYLEFVGAFIVFGIVVVGVVGIGKYFIEYRRWYRISKMNAEVHNKILDRFGSNEELLAYIDSPAGRRFLEATPLAPTAAPPRAMGAPFGRIMLSVQIGILLIAAAIGLLVVSDQAIEEVQQLLASMSILAFCLGVGSVVSAAASYVLSRRLGLLGDRAPAVPSPPL
jgi:hypothetical protein